MTKKKSSVTAAELLAKLQSDPEFVKRKQAQEECQNQRLARIRIEEEPILLELRSAGWDVESVWDMVNTSSPYPKAIPILLRHLPLQYSDVTKEGLARALAVPEPQVNDAWPLLLAEYRKAPVGIGKRAPGDLSENQLRAKDGLACALAASVTDKTLPELIALVRDRSQGESRILLLSALKIRRSKSREVKMVVAELASDPELQREIASWSRR